MVIICNNIIESQGVTMHIIIIILIIFIITLFPIPIPFKLHYYNNNLHIYIYEKEISFKKRVTKNIKHDIRSKDYFQILKDFYPLIKNVAIKLKNNPLKPRLIFNLYLNFGFEDAAKTAICFGFLNSLSPILYFSIGKFFHIKKYTFSIIPNFKSSKIDLCLKSILRISIVNTIYIVILILLVFLNNKKLKNTKILHSKEEL